jgi:hypothetical protein
VQQDRLDEFEMREIPAIVSSATGDFRPPARLADKLVRCLGEEPRNRATEHHSVSRSFDLASAQAQYRTVAAGDEQLPWPG